MTVHKILDILIIVVIMKLINTLSLILLIFIISSCNTIEKKSEETLKKENEKLSQFLGQPVTELKIVMGEPDEIIYNDKGVEFFVYTKKKYGITCQRKFEIDNNKMLTGFTSKGCF